jgi:hypothetical protein
MSTQPSSALPPPRECPLHSAMCELAELATAQHIFYLQGECLPRPDLLRRLQTWSLLHQAISSHLCPATRATLLPVEELERTLKTIQSHRRYPKTTDTSDALEETEELFQRRLSATLFACEACARATSCPLHEDASSEGKESCAWDSTQRRQP